MSLTWWKKGISWSVAVCLLASLLNFPATSAAEKSSTTLRALIFLEDERTPAEGAALIARGVASGKAYWSRPAAGDGACELRNLPAGAYDVALEVAGKVYLADSTLQLGAGEMATVRFAVKPGQPPARQAQHLPPPAGSARILQDAASPTAPAGPKKLTNGGRAFVIVGSVVLAAALTAAIAGNDNESDDGAPVSPSQP